MPAGKPHGVVVRPMTWRGVHEASAGILGHMIGGQQRNLEPVSLAVQSRQRMGCDQALGINPRQPYPLGDLGRRRHFIG